MSFIIIITLALTFVLSTQAAKQWTYTPYTPSPAAIARAANVSTGNPSKCNSGTKFYPQPINHATFDGNYDDKNSTFLQQYEVVDKFYKPGGPILFYQGAETAQIDCAEYTVLSEWVKDLGAIMVVIEHRYFGISVPHGLNFSEKATWNPSSLKELTLDNVFMDSISLLNWVKTVAFPDAEHANVIVYGASYAGSIATLLRVNHPEVFYGAIATAPATKGIISDPKDEGMFWIGNWLNMVYNDYSALASKKIKDSMADLRVRMTSGQFDGLQQDLHLCTPLNATSQMVRFARSIVGISFTNLQQNVLSNGYPFFKAINDTLAANDSMAVLAATINAYNSWHNQPCFAWDPNLKAVDPYNYLHCTYIPFPAGYTKPDSIWGSVPPHYSSKRDQDDACQAAFGINSTEGGLKYQREIGLDQATLENTTRLLFILGTMDPSSALGPDFHNPRHSLNHSRVLHVNQAAHAQDGTPLKTDSSPVVQVRQFELNAIKSWLGVV